jgi:hypothetical protein
MNKPEAKPITIWNSLLDIAVLGVLSLIKWMQLLLAVKIVAALLTARLIRPLRPLYYLGGSALWALFLYLFFSAFVHGVRTSNTWQAVLVIGVVESLFLIGFFLHWLAGAMVALGRFLQPAAVTWERPAYGATGCKDMDSQKVRTVTAKSNFDPYSVLGINRGAAKEEIRRCYHAKLNLYHPDRVAHLGAEFQSIAHEKTIEIKKAYSMLGGL